MTHPWRRVATIAVACSLCSNVQTQDTYTQGASTERRAPAETMPGDDHQAKRDVPDRARRANARSAAQVPAEEIAAAVKNELYQGVGLSLDDLDVRVERGTATLTGVVASLVAKERAAELARTVKGVTGVVNKLVVRPPDADEIESATSRGLVVSPGIALFRNAGFRPDTEIATEVDRILQWNVYIDDSRIDVDVRNGIVVLSGWVGSAAEKQRAAKNAWIVGTRDVEAKGLRVRVDAADGTATRPLQLSDANIERAVKGRLWLSPYVPESSIAVLVEGGVVTLSGTVGSPNAKRAITSLAAQTSGVNYVRDRLRVRPSMRTTFAPPPRTNQTSGESYVPHPYSA